MRTKSSPVMSSRKSLDHYPPPVYLPDEATEVYGSGLSITHSDPQCGRDDADVEIVPDTFDVSDVPHKKRHCPGTSDTGRGGSEPLNLDACTVCEISDEWVSHCSGIDCLLSFHRECLNAEFCGNEDLSNQCCPYCWFKILALKSKSVREKAIGKEKAVVKYLGKEMKSRDEVKESNPPRSQEVTIITGDKNGNQKYTVDSTDIVSEQELQGDKAVHSSQVEQVQVEKDSDKSSKKNMTSIVETDQPEEEKEKLEVGNDKSGDIKADKVIDDVEASEDGERVATENFQDAEDDETSNDHSEVNTGVVKKGDDSPFLSIQESFSGKEQDQVRQKEKRRSGRRIRIDNEISSNESTNENNQNGEDATEQITSLAEVTCQSQKTKNQQRKLSAAKPKTVRKYISYYKKDQRRRLLWTCEEEEMLKEGVEKFAAEANKNMPWRKILEIGEKVFHETRTPADLKDKWRNMIGGRVGQKMNKTQH